MSVENDDDPPANAEGEPWPARDGAPAPPSAGHAPSRREDALRAFQDSPAGDAAPPEGRRLDAPDRAWFSERLANLLGATPRPGGLALLLLDLDRFKSINHTFGHAAGDEILGLITRRLAGLLRAGGLLARIGDDEFAILVPECEKEAAGALAQRLLGSVRAPVLLRGRTITLSASVGIAVAPQDGPEAAALLRCADLALSRAKAAGRGVWRRYSQDLDPAIHARRALELDLRTAIERNELSLSYQPIFAIDGAEPLGQEALLRWAHPEHGLVPPQTFVGIAEETHLIERIGEWALARACAEAMAWPAGTSLWVNVSAIQLAQPDFEAVLDAALSASGFAPGRLVLEITETALMRSGADPARLLARLRGRGLRIALDDFGTGYSSLGYLRDHAFDYIKIDQSFVQGQDEPATAAILDAVLALGQRLGIATLAEGIETEAQLAAARRAGCALVQGHLFGRAKGPAGLASA